MHEVHFQQDNCVNQLYYDDLLVDSNYICFFFETEPIDFHESDDCDKRGTSFLFRNTFLNVCDFSLIISPYDTTILIKVINALVITSSDYGKDNGTRFSPYNFKCLKYIGVSYTRFSSLSFHLNVFAKLDTTFAADNFSCFSIDNYNRFSLIRLPSLL